MESIINKQKENFITSEEKQKLEKLPEHLKEFSDLMNERPFSSLWINHKKEFCLYVITNFYKFCGIPSDDKTLVFQTNFLFDELGLKQFGSITCSEILKAFELGQRSEFGSYFGPSQKTYNLFLSSYMKMQFRIDAVNQRKIIFNEKSVKITEKPIQVKFIEDKNSSIKAFDEFIESGRLPYARSHYYYFLWKEAGVVKWNKEEQKKISEEAKNAYIEKLTLQRKNREITKDEFERCTFQIDATNASFVRLLRELALEKFFNKLKNENKHLKDLLNDA